MNATQMRALLMSNFIAEADFTHVCFETMWPGSRSIIADILAVDGKGLIVEIEVKVSLSDLKADAQKELKHERFRQMLNGEDLHPSIPARLFYAVPAELASDAAKIVKELFPYAGVLSVGYARGASGFAKIKRGANQLHWMLAQPPDLLYLQKAATRTLARAYEVLALRCQR
jgi:hypothetical protein